MKAPRILAVLAGAALFFAFSAPGYAQAPSAERGKYIFDAGGCTSCHTDEKSGAGPLAGGAAIKTPFGIFYAPNITPDPANGIGGWTDEQFLRAMQRGTSPSGKPYYPVFPYVEYTKATRADLLDLRAYLNTIPASKIPSKPHELNFPYSLRIVLLPWQWMNFSPGEWQNFAGQDAQWNRGAYLVEALIHCGECHTPRNSTGGLDRDRWLAGARIGVDSEAGDITPHKDGIADWTENDIVNVLTDGFTPDGDALGNEMGDVIKNSTSKLTKADLQAIAKYLKSLKPLPNAVPPKK